MRLRIPLTGTVLVEGEVFGKGDLQGDEKDPIRPVDLDLGNVSWAMVNVDLVNEVMEIEVTPSEKLDEDTGEKDGDGKSIYLGRKTTELEKVALLEHARNLIEGHTKEELYEISKCPKLKRG